jgi:hypothetical protein
MLFSLLLLVKQKKLLQGLLKQQWQWLLLCIDALLALQQL